jgi:hypothetical protein
MRAPGGLMKSGFGSVSQADTPMNTQMNSLLAQFFRCQIFQRIKTWMAVTQSTSIWTSPVFKDGIKIKRNDEAQRVQTLMTIIQNKVFRVRSGESMLPPPAMKN